MCRAIYSTLGAKAETCFAERVMVCCCCAVSPQVLDDFQTDPRAARKHLQNPEIHRKISKLVSAGIIQLR